MPKSLRWNDVKAVMQLLGECRELGGDPVAWHRHFFASMAKLVSADLVLGGGMGGCSDREASNLGTTTWGFEHGFCVEAWDDLQRGLIERPTDNPLFLPMMNQLTERPAITAERQRLLPDGQWYRHSGYERYYTAIGIDHAILSWIATPHLPGEFSAVSLNREIGRRRFSEYEQDLMRLAHSEIAGMIGEQLACFQEATARSLAPRVQQVLQCLLEGDGDKQIAVRLHLSSYTVNQYTKTIYRHFGVRGRAELLAFWIRRGWPLPQF